MLTEDQIQYLYKFCIKHYVRYYDLQVELVDHLAASIENEMQQNSKLSFEEALNKVYKGFGVMGFSNVIREKETALRKIYRNQNWHFFKTYFTIPKVALTVSVFIILNIPVYVFKIQNVELLYKIYCITFASLSVAGVLYAWLTYEKPKKELLMYKASGGGSFVHAFLLLIQMPNIYTFFLKDLFNEYPDRLNLLNLMVTGVFVFVILFSLALYESMQKIVAQAKQNYPLAFATSKALL